MNNRFSQQTYRAVITGAALVLSLFMHNQAIAGTVAVPNFSAAFEPGTVGDDNVSKLTFTIDNITDNTADTLAFINILPADVVLANPAAPTTDCVGFGTTLTAPDGGTTITLAEGFVGAGESCTVSVYVKGSTPAGTKNNQSGDLTSSLGNSGVASANLIVDGGLPSFSKAFSPTMVNLGQRSTLTFTISSGSDAYYLSFTDNLPDGVEVADPANITNDCSFGAFTGGTVDAIPGGNLITLPFASLATVRSESSCAISVDVVGSATGLQDNITEEFFSSPDTNTDNIVTNGLASATLEVTADPLVLRKAFLDDPVPAGETVTLEFTLSNLDRDFSATSIGFTDNLDATLSGLVAAGLPLSVCGGSISGTGLLTFSGGSVAPQTDCSFSVDLTVPTSAATGNYPNTTSTVASQINGDSITSDPATDILFVAPVPLLSKEFTDDPVGAGNTVTLEFTVTNSSMTDSATDIAFSDELTSILPFPIVISTPTLPDTGFCNGSGTLALLVPDVGVQVLSMTDGTLAPGASCTFSTQITIPVGMPFGNYINTTEVITATVDNATVTGQPATDTLNIVAAPKLLKSFTDDPAQPDGTVTLEFNLSNAGSAPGDATDIGFTDDLNATIAGLVATGLPMNDICGTGSSLTATSGLTFSGGTLAPGAECTFAVTLQIPSAATATPGAHTNTTSSVTATVSGLTVTGNPASDDLQIAGIEVTKSFTDDPVLPGGTVELEFTVDNLSALDATAITFSDNLNAVLSGFAATTLPADGFCGAGSTLTGTNLLIFTGGNLVAGTSCSFSVSALVPMSATNGSYINNTSGVTATIDGGTRNFDPANDRLEVNSDVLALSKAFTPSAVAPGGTVTLDFTFTSLEASQTIMNIAFTDDLDAMMTGLTAIGFPAANAACGGTLSGSPILTLTGASLAPLASCSFSATLQLPAAAAAIYTNTINDATGTAGGLAVTVDPAEAQLAVSSLTLSKAFASSARPGESTTLNFTVTNGSATETVVDLSFSDDLDATLTGLVASGLPVADICGAGSELDGTGVLTMRDGILAPGGSCSFGVNVLIPLSAAAGTYTNTTSALLQASIPAGLAASADLTVDPLPIRSFTGTLPSGATGIFGFTTSDTNCAFDSNPQFIDAAAVTPAPPTDIVLADGAVSFHISGCTPGATANFSFDYGQALPPNVEYYKAGSPWFILPATITGNIVTFSITDGGPGDTDGVANGSIIDPSGAAQALPGGPAPPLEPIPVSSPLALLMLALMMMLGGGLALRYRQS